MTQRIMIMPAAAIRALAGVPRGILRRTRLQRAAAYLIILSMLLGLAASPAGVRAQEPVPGTGPRPGENDPLGGPAGRSIFRNDELFTLLPGSEVWTDFSSYTPSADLSGLTLAEKGSTNYSRSQAAAAGRILTPEREQVAIARPDGKGNIQVSLLDRGDGVPNGDYTLPNAADTRDFSGTYPMKVVVGDLDKLPDSQGQLRD